MFYMSMMSSLESQTVAITIQRCSIENYKGANRAIAIDFVQQ